MVEVSFLRDGEKAAGDGTIFPICNLKDGVLNFIGTGFFIATNGMFVTAKHVLEGEEGPLYVVHFYDEGKYLLRGIARASLSPESDFAIGVSENATSVETGESLKNTILSLSLHVPAEGETISTYAYPETTITHSNSTTRLNFVSEWYHGTVSDLYPEGMGFIKSSALIAEMESLGGCSGGPVFSEHGDGGVIGINSRGIAGQVNVVSLTSALLGVALFDVNINDDHIEHITIQQLIELGHVLVV
jgi:hypothetical protein